MAEAARVELPAIDWEAKIEEGKDYLREKLDTKKLNWRENCAIAFVSPQGKITHSGTQVCHAGLGDKGAKFVINALVSGEEYGQNPGRLNSKEVEVWFLDYILNRSAYSEVFVEKDAEKALETRMTVASGEHPANLMAAGLVALRRLWEYVWIPKVTHDLAKLGVNEDLAFILAHMMRAGNTPEDKTPALWNGCAAGHCSLNPSSFGFKNVRNFLQHKVTKPKNLFINGDYYNGYDLMYGYNEGKNFYEFVKNNFPYEDCKNAPKVAATVGLNPFAAAKVQQPVAVGQVQYHKAIEVMAKWATTTLMEKINNA